MLVSKNAKIWVTPNAKPKMCVTPNAKSQCQSVEYRLHWVPDVKILHWSCTFHVVYPVFFLVISVVYGLYSFVKLWKYHFCIIKIVAVHIHYLGELHK